MDGKWDGRRYTFGDPEGGQLDADGVEWFACDPYPTWYRWEGATLITLKPGRSGF